MNKTKDYIKTSLSFGVFLLILYACYLLILLSLPYIRFEAGVDFLSTKQLIYHIKIWRVSFYIHVFTSPIIILAGLFQFNRYVLRRWRKLHRTMGYIYIIDVLLVSGPAAFIMSMYANGGRITQISFVSLSILWILFTYLAFSAIKKGDSTKHVKWIIRSYALTLSAVTLRFYSYLFGYFKVDLPPQETYTILAYISWIPNLIFAELMIYWKYPKFLLNQKE